MRLFEKRVLRRIIGPKTVDITRSWKQMHNKELIICNLQQIFVDQINEDETDVAHSMHETDKRFIQNI